MKKSSTAASSYAAKLRDPRWQKKRLEVLERAGWACEMCGDHETTLHVHHKQYLKGREPWEYDADQLAALCEFCHEHGHCGPDLLLNVVSRLAVDGPRSREAAAKLVAGFAQQESDFEFGRMYWHLGNIAAALSYMNLAGIQKLARSLEPLSEDESERALAHAIGGLIHEVKRYFREPAPKGGAA